MNTNNCSYFLVYIMTACCLFSCQTSQNIVDAPRPITVNITNSKELADFTGGYYYAIRQIREILVDLKVISSYKTQIVFKTSGEVLSDYYTYSQIGEMFKKTLFDLNEAYQSCKINNTIYMKFVVGNPITVLVAGKYNLSKELMQMDEIVNNSFLDYMTSKSSLLKDGNSDNVTIFEDMDAMLSYFDKKFEKVWLNTLIYFDRGFRDYQTALKN